MLKKYASIIRTIAFVVPVICIIGGLVLAVNAEDYLLFVYFAIPALLAYVFMRSYAELLEATEDTQTLIYQIQEQLPENSKSSSSPIFATSNTAQPTTKPAANGWTCSCGRTNPAYTSTCICGKNKREIEYAANASNEPVTARKDESNPDYIVCPKCGARQRNNRKCCFECGVPFNSDTSD